MVVIAIFTKGTSPSVGWVAGGECYEEEVVCYSLVLEGCLVAVFVYVDTTARFSLLPRFSIGAGGAVPNWRADRRSNTTDRERPH